MEALASFKKSKEKDRAAQWIICVSSIRRGRVFSDEFFAFIQMSFFEVEGWGSRVGMANGGKLETDVYGEVDGLQT